MQTGMVWHHGSMKDKQSFQQFLELCQQVFERMEREDSWPWHDQSDSPKSEDLVESEDNFDKS